MHKHFATKCRGAEHKTGKAQIVHLTDFYVIHKNERAHQIQFVARSQSALYRYIDL